MSGTFFTKNQTIALIIAFVIVAPLAVLALWPGLFMHGPAKFPGSLVMEVPSDWTAPSGETVSGLVLYTPAEGSVSHPFAPNLGVVVPVSLGTFSPDGTLALGIRASASSSDLVLVSRRAQAVTQVIDLAPPGTIYTNFAWSPDGKRVAYTHLPSLRSLPLAPDGKPYFVQNGATSTLRAGVTLPAAYQPSTYVSALDGSGATSLETASPIMFSPDNSKLLVSDSQGLGIIDIASGTRTTVSGISDKDSSALIVPDPSGASFVAISDGMPADAYGIDWAIDAAQPLGTLDAKVTNVFFAGSAIIGIDPSAGTFQSYSVSNHALVKGPSYQIALPEHGYVIGWLLPQ